MLSICMYALCNIRKISTNPHLGFHIPAFGRDISPAIAMWRAIRRSADGSNPCPKELGQGAGPIARNVATRSPPEGGRGDRPKNLKR